MSESTQVTHTCIRCSQAKPVGEFYVRSDTGKLKNTCKVCHAVWCREYSQTGPQAYGRYNRYDRPNGQRACRICGEAKALAEFQPRTGRQEGSWRNECRPCFLKLARDRYAKDPKKHRDVMRRSMYGLSAGEYDRMHAKQAGLCAICGEPETSPERYTGKPRKLFVDHHHGTGQVRALLCMRCNMGIGQFRDDPQLLAKAIAYLNKHHGI